MAPEKPHPLGLSPEAGNAVTKLLKEQQEAEARANAPKDNKPEDVKAVVARIVEDYSSGEPATPPEPEKKERRGFLRRR
jgi:hypothetical protein